MNETKKFALFNTQTKEYFVTYAGKSTWETQGGAKCALHAATNKTLVEHKGLYECHEVELKFIRVA